MYNMKAKGGGGGGGYYSSCLSSSSYGIGIGIGTGGGDEDVRSMMLKFRPIAPKPLLGCFNCSRDVYVACESRLAKRKYVKTNNNNNNMTKKKKKKNKDHKYSAAATANSDHMKAVTLCLLPETPDPKQNDSFSDLMPTRSLAPVSLSCFDVNQQQQKESRWVELERGKSGGQVVSSVTVECVTDTWMVLSEGVSDEERVRRMEKDTCPGFISEGEDNRVVWTNKAYEQMVGTDKDVAVVLRRNDTWPPVAAAAAFTCKVTVVNANRVATKQTLPCDVWRMKKSGGWAWRLDVNAALSLGR